MCGWLQGTWMIFNAQGYVDPTARGSLFTLELSSAATIDKNADKLDSVNDRVVSMFVF